jgi:hypothetical protein
MLNQAAGNDVTLGHYVGKSEAQLRAGWQAVGDFIECAANKVVAKRPRNRQASRLERQLAATARRGELIATL